MAARSNTLPLVLVALVLAGGLAMAAVFGGLFQPASPEPAPSLGRSKGQASEALETAGQDSVPSAAQAPLERTQIEELVTEVEVVPVDGSGRKLQDVQLTLTGPGGERIERQDGGVLSGLAPGLWKIMAEREGLLTGHAEVELTAGRRRQRVVQLLEHLRISGRVIDNHGEPQVRARVWLLGPGQSHPSSEVVGKSRLTAITDRQGEFRFEPPKPALYRFSVGAPGAARWEQRKATELTSAGPDRAQLVIPSASRLVLSVAENPVTPIVGTRARTVEVLAQRQSSGPGARQGRSNPGGRQRSERPKDQAQGADDAAAQGQTDEGPSTPPRGGGKGKKGKGGAKKPSRDGPSRPAAPPAGPSGASSSSPDFVRWQNLGLRPDEDLWVPSAPVDRELRIALTVMGHRYVSDSGFTLSPGLTTRVSLHWPARGSKGGSLAIEVRREPPDPDSPQVGCTWAE